MDSNPTKHSLWQWSHHRREKSFSTPLLAWTLIGLWCLGAISASATTYYVAPASASAGSSCIRASPCSLTTGLSKGRAGDEVVLLNGTYNTHFDTEGDGVVIRADQKHQAIVTFTQSHSTGKQIIGIKHDNITIRGLRIDGQGKAGRNHGLIRFFKSRHIIIEDNLVENGAGELINIGGSRPNDQISQITVRNNVIQGAGFNNEYGEGIYIGYYQGSSDNVHVREVEIYGNTLRQFSDNGIDIKPPTNGVDMHHNIFEDQVERGGQYGNTGTLVMQGNAHRFHDNIIRNVVGGSAVLNVISRGGNKVYDNVVRTSRQTSKAVRSRGSGSGSPTLVTDNLFCDLSSTTVDQGTMTIKNNPGLDLPQQDCRTREQQIEREMARLTGHPSVTKVHAPRVLRILSSQSKSGSANDIVPLHPDQL